MTEEKIVLSNQQIIYHVRKVLDHALLPQMQQLQIANPGEYTKQLTLAHMDFSQSNPSLFYAIVDNPKTFDMNRLKEMLDVRKKIMDKKISQETADKEMGQKYYDEFVHKHIDELDKKAGK